MTKAIEKKRASSINIDLALISGLGEFYFGAMLFFPQLDEFIKIIFPGLEKINDNYWALINIISSIAILLFMYIFTLNRVLRRDDIDDIQKRNFKLIRKVLDIVGIIFLLIFLLCLIAIFAMLKFDWKPGIPMIEFVNLIGSKIFLVEGLFIGFLFSLAGYIYNTPRFYIDGLLMGSMIILIPIVPTNITKWSMIFSGLYLIIIGTVALIRFTRKYPLPDKDAQPQNIEVEK